ncbi:hypothetical protein PS938_02642 [Pseudomonas fluorescens]|uniref:Uncharacterized protein n=2 Tax=Pseudomonas fluorescens TaxID=294 RepID=A0A5E7TWL5_PSEFL|nr:hypothetical protein PS938_02642 [Pseudomonas fluorescens]
MTNPSGSLSLSEPLTSMGNSHPMFTVTDIDKDLLLPLSGRDPLGIMPLWQRRARDLVPALTGSSRYAEGFQVLLTALAWWPEFAQDSANNTPKDQQKFFILIEQAFARACRCAGVDWPLPGSRRLNSVDEGVWISLQSDHQLLDSPLANGVWGLYRGPALNAQLIDAHNRIDEKLARKIREQTPIIEALFKGVRAVLRGSEDYVLLAQRPSAKVVSGLKAIIEQVPSRRIILDALVTPASSMITQELAMLSQNSKQVDDIRQFVIVAIETLPAHAIHLKNVQRCEGFIAPLEAIFEYLCSMANLPLARVEMDLAVDLLALREAANAFAAGGNYEGSLQARVDQLLGLDLSSKQRLIISLLDHHRAVSESRGNAPWLQLDEQGKLECSLVISAPLPEQLLPASAWRNRYYLDCLGALSRQLRAGSSR